MVKSLGRKNSFEEVCFELETENWHGRMRRPLINNFSSPRDVRTCGIERTSEETGYSHDVKKN